MNLFYKCFTVLVNESSNTSALFVGLNMSKFFFITNIYLTGMQRISFFCLQELVCDRHFFKKNVIKDKTEVFAFRKSLILRSSGNFCVIGFPMQNGKE